MPLYLSESEVAELLTPADALAAVEGCFLRMSRGAIENRPRTRRVEDGVFAVMAAADDELRRAGVKAYTWLSGGTPFVVILFDLERAAVAAVIEADKLGQLEPAARAAWRRSTWRSRMHRRSG